ncbi:MAG: hypothetical protein ABIX10_05945 [Acidimicrobiales bacterium]
MAQVITGAARGRVSWGAAGGMCILAAGMAVGLRPLADNSFFTHLATGRIILDDGAVPSVDPYTFTAQGDPWVVQSWLASLLYGVVEQLGGSTGLRLLMGTVAAALALLAWRLTRPAEGVVIRIALAGVAVAVGAELWAERPFMLGLLALATVAIAADDGLDPHWLVPVGWLWVNVHGSFPLGLVYLLVLLLGRRLDHAAPGPEASCLKWLIVGIALGAVNPVGPRLLVFPVELLQRQDVLRNVVEWRSPGFEGASQRLFLFQLAACILLLVRRPSYRSGLVIVVFATAALLGARNLPVASILLLPVMASAAPALGSLRSSGRDRTARMLAAAGLAGLVLVVMSRLRQPDFDLRSYPVDALAHLEEASVVLEAHRLATPDTAGNLLELLYGSGERVFYDDRFDMFPDEVSAAHLSLVRADTGVRDALAGHDIDLVLWTRRGSLVQRLSVDPAWRVIYSDEQWTTLCRRGAELGGDLGRC